MVKPSEIQTKLLLVRDDILDVNEVMGPKDRVRAILNTDTVMTFMGKIVTKTDLDTRCFMRHVIVLPPKMSHFRIIQILHLFDSFPYPTSYL